MSNEIIKSALITNMAGIHARPAVKIAKAAKKFDADIHLSIDDSLGWVNAKSTSLVMKMKGRSGAKLTVKSCGADADAAADAIIELIKDKFGED